jgi:hypothetical protein
VHGSKDTLPLVEDYGDGLRSPEVEWEGMTAEISTFPAGFDAAPFFTSLPNGMCQSRHWGYVIKGRVRMRYRDREEVLGAGDAYYLEPGHAPVYEEDTAVVEFSPIGEYQITLEAVAGNATVLEETE